MKDVNENFKQGKAEHEDSIWGDISRLCNDVARIKLRVDKVQEDLANGIADGISDTGSEVGEVAEGGAREMLRFVNRKAEERDEIDESVRRFLGLGPSEDVAQRIPKAHKSRNK